MATFQEHQNLPGLQDVPVLENRELMDYLLTLKELIEDMLGRREATGPPAIPQMQIGTYVGDGVEGRQIEVNFRPRYVQVFARPSSAGIERIYTKLDDPNQNIDWGEYSLRHNTTDLELVLTSGIIEINDNGFTVDGLTSHPNVVGITYDWIAFG